MPVCAAQHHWVRAAPYTAGVVTTASRRPIDPASCHYAPELCLDGEDAVVLVTGADHLVRAYALLLEDAPAIPPPTHSWWALRCCVLRQRVLASPSATLAAHVDRLAPLLEAHSCAALCIELALAHQVYGRVADAARCLSRAEELADVSLHVDGAMGMRTVHQQEAKAQLVVRIASCAAEELSSVATSELMDEEHDNEPGMPLGAGIYVQQSQHTDVLPLPVLSGDDHSTTLPPLLQSLLLTHAKHIERTTAADELRPWQMAPFVEAVLSQPRTTPSIYYAARLLRAQHERARSRTRARALLAYERLLACLRRTTPPAHKRLPFALAIPLPMHARLRREAADEMVSCGMVGDALVEYESLQEWDALVACYRLLGKAQAAEALVTQRLQVEPQRASLWCTLGDLHNDDAMYERALQVSSHRSVRALRALARSAMGRLDWSQGAVRWEAALAINPLHEQGWFALGYCCLKQHDAQRALQAFTR